LASGGHTIMRLVPSLVMLGVAVVGWRRRSVWLVHVGFLLAVVLLVLFMAVDPSDYPF
jgi:hypothetical protein